MSELTESAPKDTRVSIRKRIFDKFEEDANYGTDYDDVDPEQYDTFTRWDNREEGAATIGSMLQEKLPLSEGGLQQRGLTQITSTML